MPLNETSKLPNILAGILALWIMSPCVASAADVADAQPGGWRPPNIVFIIADDLGVNDLSCYGRQDQSTPRLDELASQGLRFTTAYAAQSVCSPTRAALMTGRAPARLHLTTFLPGRGDAPSQLLLQAKIEQQLPLAEVTIAERLKAAGYATACFGKWHLGGKGFMPTDQGFDIYFAGKANTPPSGTEGGKGEYELTAHAEQFIESNRDRPFFLYIGHNCPHVPLAAKTELVEKHSGAFNPVYAAMIETLDACVGRVVDKVNSLGLAERTLIVFTSDNGGLHVPEGPRTPATHNTPCRAGKGFCYEGGLRIPLIVCWPGHVAKGRLVDTPVISTDWTPTLAELAHVPIVEQLDGLSFAKLLTGGEALPPRALYWHLPHYTNQGSRPSGAIRESDWKLVEHYEDGRCELFNLAQDPSETTDLASQQPGRVAELRGKLEKWRREVGAQENVTNPDFNGNLWKQLYQDEDVSRLVPEPTPSAKSEPMEAKLKSWRRLLNAVVSGPASSEPKTPSGAGAIVLHARDAKIHGMKLRYEPEPHKDTLGFWVVKDDWAEWEFESPKAGLFDVELLQGAGKGSGGAEIEVTLAGQTLTMTVEETGHFQRFVPRSIGTLKLDQPGKYALSVKAKTKPREAVMDLRRVTLRAAP